MLAHACICFVRLRFRPCVVLTCLLPPACCLAAPVPRCGTGTWPRRARHWQAWCAALMCLVCQSVFVPDSGAAARWRIPPLRRLDLCASSSRVEGASCQAGGRRERVAAWAMWAMLHLAHSHVSRHGALPALSTVASVTACLVWAGQQSPLLLRCLSSSGFLQPAVATHLQSPPPNTHKAVPRPATSICTLSEGRPLLTC